MAMVSRTLVILGLAGIIAPNAWGDIIPTHHSRASKERTKVESKLKDLGLTKADATDRASRLTEDEAAYFARNTERVRMVGQEMWGGQTTTFWWEFLFGALALGGVIFGVYSWNKHT